MKKFYSLLTLAFLPVVIMAQPANDDCAGAINLVPDTMCVPVTGDITGGTESLPAITCNGFTGSADADVWYMFTATDTAHNVNVTGSVDFDAVVELFDGTCGTLTSRDCADATLEGELESIVSTDLTIGTTYYVRVYHWYDTIPTPPTFEICIVTPPPPPPNNNLSPNNEGFEDGLFPPPCWTLLDQDGDGANWFTYSPSPHSGDTSAASASWNGAPLTPENYMILPQVTPGQDEHLTYYVAAQDPAYPSENYSVVVSTTGMAAADFTDELFNEVLVDETWLMREIDLSAYQGMDIYIAFKHFNVTDQFIFKIDDVQWPTETNPCTVGIQESELNISLNLFPNPSTGEVNLQSSDVILNMDVLDISGKLVLSEQVNKNIHVIEDGTLESGVYMVTLQFEKGSVARKLIIE